MVGRGGEGSSLGEILGNGISNAQSQEQIYARNVSFENNSQWPINIINSVGKTKLSRDILSCVAFFFFFQVNTQLFSASEKKQLAELIDTMIAYNVTFHQERNFDGQYTYVLDP